MAYYMWLEVNILSNISAPQLFRFGMNSVLKIVNERMTQLMNE